MDDKSIILTIFLSGCFVIHNTLSGDKDAGKSYNDNDFSFIAIDILINYSLLVDPWIQEKEVLGQ